MRLKIENMERVLILRGDHEIGSLNISSSNGTIFPEIQKKFEVRYRRAIFSTLSKCYNYFCTALFVHCASDNENRFILVCCFTFLTCSKSYKLASSFVMEVLKLELTLQTFSSRKRRKYFAKSRP